MKNNILKNVMVSLVVFGVLMGISLPILHSQVQDVLMGLNLEKNREQAERLATLVSIDLEKGEQPDVILRKVQTMLENTPQSSEHFACIVEDENRVIAHPNPAHINKDVTGWTLFDGIETKTYTQSAGEGIPFGGLQTRTNGTQDLTFQIPISTKPWSVAVHTKLELVEEQAALILEKIVLFFILVFLLVLLVHTFLMTRKHG